MYMDDKPTDDEILEQGGADLTEDIGDSAFPFRCTLRQKPFVEVFLQTGNGTEAAVQAGYSGSRKALSVRSAILLKTPKVIQYLQHLMLPESGKITPEYIKEALHREALTSPNPTARAKCLEILGRYIGIDVHRVSIDVYAHKDVDELLADLQTVKRQAWEQRGDAFISDELLTLLLLVGRRDRIENVLKGLPARTDGRVLEHAA